MKIKEKWEFFLLNIQMVSYEMKWIVSYINCRIKQIVVFKSYTIIFGFLYSQVKYCTLNRI